MKKLWINFAKILFVPALVFQTSLSQTISVSFLNGTVIAGPKYQIDVYVQANTGTPKMGTSNIAYSYNTVGFGTNVSSTITPTNFSGGNYIAMNITDLLSNTKSINIELSVPGSGTVISSISPGTKVATIEMNIANTTQTSNIQLDISNSPIFADDEATPFIVAVGTNDNTPLPVQLLTFSGVTKGRKIELTWKTAVEVNSSTFEIERRSTAGWEKRGELQAAGTSNKPHEYTFADNLTNAGKENILYRLKTVDNDGSFQYSSELEISSKPTVYSLENNFPNPFNPQTRIQYSLPENARVRLVVFDMIGREVRALVDEEQSAGFYEKSFTGLNLSSGIYFYRITAQAQGKNIFSQVKKMLLLK